MTDLPSPESPASPARGEDPDLALRVRGWNLIYDPSALATHRRYDNLKSILAMYCHALFIHFRYNFLGPAKQDFLALGCMPYRQFQLMLNGSPNSATKGS